MDLNKIPEHMIIIGAGVIGLELGQVYQRMGSKITVIEYFDRITPSLDKEVGKEFTRFLKKQKFKFLFNKKCLKGVKDAEGVSVLLEDNKTQK